MGTYIAFFLVFKLPQINATVILCKITLKIIGELAVCLKHCRDFRWGQSWMEFGHFLFPVLVAT